jgi:asparagine synthase (glutamine-hydrolysing)
MCGIAGFWRRGGTLRADDSQTVRRMAQSIAHRGPDDSGIWTDSSAGIALAHVRLSILDLSPAGHQPMVSHSGRYIAIFNGEIYNHSELRTHLPEIRWRGCSDTETLLAGIDTWGVETALSRSVGMFALAVWDRQRQVLSLARDRIGEKPLYFGSKSGIVFFASELKAVKAHPDFVPNVDRSSLALYMRHCYVPAPYSISEGISKLMPS